MHRRALLLLLLLAALVGTACAETTAANVRTISTEDAAALIQSTPDLTIIDVRTPEEFADGHLDGAVLVDFRDADFETQIGAFDRDGSYLIYCRTGNRSAQARQVMADLGFTDVADMGGIEDWIAAGFEVVT